ncbi:MAG TPA: hypothetical protein VI981_04875 [Candidatus Paceibacterota bacterium]
MKKITTVALVATFVTLAVAVPMVAFAQPTPPGTGNLSNLEVLVESVRRIVNMLIPLAFAIALLVFFWGLAKFILASGNEEAKDTGKRIMIWGIIALFVMASVWGIVAFIGNALGIGQGQNIPSVPGVIDRDAGF